jgi:hypothetical protein
MTPAERDRIRERVEKTCAEQGIDVIVPPEVAADVARLLAGAWAEWGADAAARSA